MNPSEAEVRNAVDLATVLEISRAVSGEIAPDRLLEALLRTALEHAGAERGLLIVPRGTELSVVAEANLRGTSLSVRMGDTPIAAANLPQSIVRHVAGSLTSVVANDASVDDRFSADAYVQQVHPRTVLCLPLLLHERLVAVLYLETRLAPTGVTPAQIAALEVIVTQAGPALENSRRFRELQEREAKLSRLVDANLVGVMEADIDGRVLEANDALLAMVGYTREDLAAGHIRWTEMTPPEWEAVTRRAVEQILANGSCDAYEKEYLRKDGSRVPVLVAAAAIGAAQNRTVAFVLDLTDRRRAEHELRAAETRFRTFVDHATDALFVHDAQAVVIEVNRQACESLGYTREELIGKAPHEFDPKVKSDAALLEWVQQRLNGGEIFAFESVHQRKDGSVFPVDIRIRPFWHAGQRFALAVARDITERKRAEVERQTHLWFLESMERVNRAIQGTNDLDQMMYDVVDAALEIFGAERALLGTFSGEPEPGSFRVAVERATPEFPSPLVRGVEYPVDDDLRALSGVLRAAGGPVQFRPGSEPPLPAVVAERYGLRSVLSMAVYPKLGDPDSFYHFSLGQCSSPRVWSPQEVRLFQEIGHRLGDALATLSLLRTLRQSEARLEEAQQIAHVGHWDYDLDTGQITCSNETCRILGVSPDEHRSTVGFFRESIHPEDQPIRQRTLDEVAAGAARYDAEYRIVRPDGEVRVVHARGTVIRDESGKPHRIFGTTQDITERKQAEEALRRAQIELAHVTRAVTMAEIGASIAHEVNQPLAAVVMGGNAVLRWLAASPPAIEDARTATRNVLANAERASQIVMRIRAMLRSGEPEGKLLDINELIRETLALLRTELARSEITTRTELDATLPQALGDRVQLQQVLFNLILNARDAMTGATGAEHVLTIRSRPSRLGEAEGMIVEVQDSGKGLGDMNPNQIFQPFYSTKSGGLGMGLAISRSIVEAHGGQLDATPNQGAGLTLRFTLPLRHTLQPG